MHDSPAAGRVRLEIDDDVARIVLDAPARHNALEAEDLASFVGHLDLVDADRSVRVLVVTGAGEETFCAGASLRQMESGEMSGELFQTLTDRLEAARVPSICALNGSVYGGGAEIALSCDFRLGVEGMRLSVPAAKLGVCYPVGGLGRYVRRLGLAAAVRILVSGDELKADELVRIGFLTDLVDRDSLQPATELLAGRIATRAPLAVQAMKRLLNGIASGRLDAAEAEALIARCTASEDLREGLRARREGREPVFEGR